MSRGWSRRFALGAHLVQLPVTDAVTTATVTRIEKVRHRVEKDVGNRRRRYKRRVVDYHAVLAGQGGVEEADVHVAVLHGRRGGSAQAPAAHQPRRQHRRLGLGRRSGRGGGRTYVDVPQLDPTLLSSPGQTWLPAARAGPVAYTRVALGNVVEPGYDVCVEPLLHSVAHIPLLGRQIFKVGHGVVCHFGLVPLQNRVQLTILLNPGGLTEVLRRLHSQVRPNTDSVVLRRIS